MKVTLKESNELIRNMEALVWSIVSNYNGISNTDKEDIKQNTLIYLHNEIIPKYDKTKGAKLSSFAYPCINNFIKRQLSSINSQNKNTISMSDKWYKQRDDHDQSAAIASEKINIIMDLIDDDFFKPKERAVIFIMNSNPKITQKEIAMIMGYSHPSAVSMIVSRMRKKIKSSSIMEEACF